jgi:choline dehydrogenase-like flavoprotein
VLLDARSLPQDTVIETDVCIVGAGAAGIAMARELAGQPVRVVLLESGGVDFDPDVQALYRGETVGAPSAALDESRLRYLGGTSNHWMGYCRPLDPEDLGPRPWVPLSGWPIGPDELAPWYARAGRVLEVEGQDYTAPHWQAHISPLLKGPLTSGRLRAAVFQQSPPTRLGERYRQDLERADNLRTLLHANLVDILTDAAASTVTGLAAACLDGRRFVVRPRIAVLACGGIENPRLLLNARGVAAAGLGNAHGWVGRCFMDHPAYEAADILLDVDPDLARQPATQLIDTLIGLDPEIERAESLCRFATYVFPRREAGVEAAGYRAVRDITKALRRGRLPDHLWQLIGTAVGDLDGVAGDLWQRFVAETPMLAVRIHPEVAPSPDSRVTLAAERCPLGLQRARLDWRLSEIDRRTIRRGLAILGEELGRHGLGRLRLAPWVLEDGFDVPGNGSYHHVGTTRMSEDPRRGVVDRHGLVHGMANLYLAGSSVFPTCGYANPTLTIVALALRLADRLKAMPA